MGRSALWDHSYSDRTRGLTNRSIEDLPAAQKRPPKITATRPACYRA